MVLVKSVHNTSERCGRSGLVSQQRRKFLKCYSKYYYSYSKLEPAYDHYELFFGDIFQCFVVKVV